jgi:hypothetical protein
MSQQKGKLKEEIKFEMRSFDVEKKPVFNRGPHQ